MKQWFSSLSARERIMVQIAAIVVSLFLLYLVVIEPVSEHYEINRKKVANAQQTLQWMQQAAREIRALSGNKTVSLQPKSKQFLLGVIDRSVKKAGLAAQMKRIQPETEGGVRIWFEQVEFDSLINWLSGIKQQQDLVVNEINIEKTEAPGRVNVRLYLN